MDEPPAEVVIGFVILNLNAMKNHHFQRYLRMVRFQANKLLSFLTDCLYCL